VARALADGQCSSGFRNQSDLLKSVRNADVEDGFLLNDAGRHNIELFMERYRASKGSTTSMQGDEGIGDEEPMSELRRRRAYDPLTDVQLDSDNENFDALDQEDLQLRQRAYAELGTTHTLCFVFFKRFCVESEGLDLEDTLQSLFEAGSFGMPTRNMVMLVGAGSSETLSRPYEFKPFMMNPYLPVLLNRRGCYVAFSLQVERDKVVQETKTCLNHQMCSTDPIYTSVRRFFREMPVFQPKVV